MLAIWAVMGAARSWAAIADAAEDLEADLSEQLRLRHPRWGLPHAATVRRALLAIDILALEGALRRWAIRRVLALAAARASAPIRQRPPIRELRAVYAVDGKVVRGSALQREDASHGGDGGRAREQQVALVSVLDVASGLVLTQNAIGTGGEVTAARGALADIDEVTDLRGCLVTADAAHTARDTAAFLVGRGAHYLARVGGNTPTLHAFCTAQPWGPIPGQVARGLDSWSWPAGVTFGQGRQPHQAQLVLLQEVFPGAVQLIKVVRRRRALDGTRTRARRKVKTTVEVVYFVTSLDHRQADPGLLAAWAKSHWRIENRLHYVRDVTFGEDASQVRVGSGPQLMAAIRNLVIGLARLAGSDNIARCTRRWCRRGPDALDVLLAA